MYVLASSKFTKFSSFLSRKTVFGSLLKLVNVMVIVFLLSSRTWMMDTSHFNLIVLNRAYSSFMQTSISSWREDCFLLSVTFFPPRLFHSLGEWSGEQSVRVPWNRNRTIHSLFSDLFLLGKVKHMLNFRSVIKSHWLQYDLNALQNCGFYSHLPITPLLFFFFFSSFATLQVDYA